MTTMPLIQLLFAHVVADFVLQPNWLCKAKAAKGYKDIMTLLGHSAIHAVLAYFLVGAWSCWQLPVLIVLSHFAIDYFKVKCQKATTANFLIDQAAHLAVLVALWLVFFVEDGAWFESVLAWNKPHWLLIAIGFLLVLQPSSLLLGLFIAKWTPPHQAKSLPKAGQWIGYLERILIMVFILSGYMEGIGFLLAAKSVFRFGELKDNKELSMTEYVLIGTLSSFVVAIVIGFLVKYSLQCLPPCFP